MVDDLLNTDGISKEYLVILKQIEDYCNRGPEIDLDSQGITCGPSRVNGESETDGAKLSTMGPSRVGSTKKTLPSRKTSGSKTPASSSSSASAGAVDEADFENAFF